MNWRTVAKFEDDDDDPTEQYLYHQAGLDGSGNSSYIDAVVLRQRDTDANGTLEEHLYYCQNWRQDVVAIVTSTGAMQEWVKYSSYGIPFGLPAGDTDSDGDCDSTDVTAIQNWTAGYDVRYDLDLDGNIQANDASIASGTFQGTTMGWNVLSNPDIDNPRGYAGYRWKQNTSKYEVRNRFFDPHLGRWTRRDPVNYYGGLNLFGYTNQRPIVVRDPSGLFGCTSSGFECCWKIPQSANMLALCGGCSVKQCVQPCICGPDDYGVVIKRSICCDFSVKFVIPGFGRACKSTGGGSLRVPIGAPSSYDCPDRGGFGKTQCFGKACYTFEINVAGQTGGCDFCWHFGDPTKNGSVGCRVDFGDLKWEFGFTFFKGSFCYTCESVMCQSDPIIAL